MLLFKSVFSLEQLRDMPVGQIAAAFYKLPLDRQRVAGDMTAFDVGTAVRAHANRCAGIVVSGLGQKRMDKQFRNKWELQ